MTTEEQKLYDRKGELWQKMNDFAADLKRGKDKTLDEERQFEAWDTEYRGIAKKAEIIKRGGELEAEATAKSGKSFAGNGEERLDDTSSKFEFRDRKGNEVPVFSIAKPAPKETGSIADWYFRNYNVDKSLENMTAGDLVHAYLEGPRSKTEERALSEGVDSLGGYSVPDAVAAKFYDDIRAKSHVFRAGAQTVLLDSKNHAFCKITGDPTASWIAEAGAITASDVTIDTIPFAAKSLKAKVIASGELLQDSLNVREVIHAAMVGAFSNEIDRSALEGNGTGETPLGIYGYTSPSTYSMGTNGAAITNWDFLVDAIKAMLDNNCPIPTHMMMHPRTWAVLTKLKNANNDPLPPPFNLSDLVHKGMYETTKTSITQVQGTSSNASSIYLGGFQNLFYGLRLGLRIIPTHELLSTNYQYSFLAVSRSDWQPRREADFGLIEGIIP